MCRSSAAMDQEEFDTFVTRGLALWLEIISDWVTHAADLHIIFYEVISACNIPILVNNNAIMQNLRANTMEEMRQLLQHLSLPGDEARLACIQRSLQPRQPRLGGDGDPYTRD